MADDSTMLIEKIRSLASKPVENAEILRTLTAKLQSRLTGSDISLRQSTLENLWKLSEDVTMLITIMEGSRDICLCNNVAAILREIVCLSPGKGKLKKVQKKKQQSFDMNGDQNGLNIVKTNQSPTSEVVQKANGIKVNNVARQTVIFQSIQQNSTSMLVRVLLQVNARKEPSTVNVEYFLCDLLWILSQMSQKDPKFSVKARMLGGVKIIHSLLRMNMTNTKILFPLLNLMKQLSKHSITTAMLVRDGVVSTYEKVLISLGYMPTARLRLCLDTINYFSRNKTCCIQLVKSGVVHILFRIFERWDKYEGRMRIKICSHILQTLQHLCIIKSGRRTIALKKHIQILQKFCTCCPDEDLFDRLLSKVCSIICICVSNKCLPVKPSSPAVFSLTNIYNDDSSLNQKEQDINNMSDSSSEEENTTDNEFSLSKGDSEGGSDSDFLQDRSNDDNFKNSNELLSGTNFNFVFQSFQRDVEDLKRYNTFFREFSRLQKQLRLVKSNSKGLSMDDYGANVTSSNFSINKMDHSDLLQGLLVNSTPSLIYNMESEKKLRTQLKYKTNTNKIRTIGNTTCMMKFLRDKTSSNALDIYVCVASNVKSIIPFVKVPYPNLHGSEAFCEPEYLNNVERSTYRKKLVTCVERAINPDLLMNEVVYDLDTLCGEDSSKLQDRLLSNNDVQKLMCRQYQHKKLEFESRFESGNLRKVIQIGPREYDLILMPDVNANKRHLWFYFEVSNMSSGCSYVFNIVNCEKSDSQFNFGMKPVMYSVKEATLGRPGWVRAGTDICYYRNSYQMTRNKTSSKCYLTVTFTIDFPHSYDVCYLAYHFPYTYSQMMTNIWLWSRNLTPNIYFRAEPLCHSLNSNEVPLLTITANDTINNPIQEREIIFLTSRVHPGESNASWVMEGTLQCLLEQSPLAERLRSLYVFKIVPMLNIEGVINGCYRCGLTNEDLNRRWSKPSPILHPGIYHAKGLLEYMSRALRRPAAVFCDYHGHSKKKNVFLYGCSREQSWCVRDRDLVVSEKPLNYLCLPVAMQKCCPAFSDESCSFRVERERESTARVTVWRQLCVELSYTLETSFCGFDQGPYKGLQLNTSHLKEIGKDLCTALATLKDAAPNDIFFVAEDNGKDKEIDSDASSSENIYSLSDSEEDIE